MTRSRRPRRIALAAAGIIALFAIPPSLFVAWKEATHNFGVVQSGRLYRSDQMPGPVLAATIRQYQIKTVLNLRGENLAEGWYLDELKATRDAGATHIDIAMSSCLWMSRDQLRALVRTLQTADRPVLVHCLWGSERTGLASAFAELLRPGSTLADARAQLSLRFLYAPLGDGKVMTEHIDQYERWLVAHRLDHSPREFARWVNRGFQPGRPGREEWPYDPYPLVTIKYPGGKLQERAPHDDSSAIMK